MHVPEVLGETTPGVATKEVSIAMMTLPSVHRIFMLLQCMLRIDAFKDAVAKLTTLAVCVVEVDSELGLRRVASLLI